MIFRKITDWKKWNHFVQNNEGSSFLNYSFWLDTYGVFPFLIKKIGFEIIDNYNIVGGISGIQIGFWKFAYIVFPSGPLFNSEISEVEKVSFFKWFFEHKSMNSKKIQFATELNLDLYYKNLNKGKSIKLVYLNSGNNLILMKDSEQQQLIEFKTKVRRDINVSLRKGLDLVKVVNTTDLKKVYDLFKQNSLDAGYKIRPYWFYKKSWIKSLSDGQSIFFMAMKDSQVKGAIWLIDCGKRLHYVMGGTIKEKPDLYVGYFLQWHAIKLSISKQYLTYNISVGGSQGVRQFKSDFGSTEFNPNKYYYIKN